MIEIGFREALGITESILDRLCTLDALRKLEISRAAKLLRDDHGLGGFVQAQRGRSQTMGPHAGGRINREELAESIRFFRSSVIPALETAGL